MRILLCDLETGKFYGNPKHWVHNPRQATAFADIQCLLDASKDLARTRLAMIALNDKDRPQLAVPLWGISAARTEANSAETG